MLGTRFPFGAWNDCCPRPRGCWTDRSTLRDRSKYWGWLLQLSAGPAENWECGNSWPLGACLYCKLDGGTLLRSANCCLVWFAWTLCSGVCCAAGLKSCLRTPGRSLSVFLQASDRGDCASQIYRRACVSVDISLPNSLVMNAIDCNVA